jgi:hypothetical protein
LTPIACASGSLIEVAFTSAEFDRPGIAPTVATADRTHHAFAKEAHFGPMWATPAPLRRPFANGSCKLPQVSEV